MATDTPKFCKYLPLSIEHWKLIRFMDDETLGYIVRSALDYCVSGGTSEYEPLNKMEDALFEYLKNAADIAHEQYVQQLEASAKGVEARLSNRRSTDSQLPVNGRSTSGQPLKENKLKKEKKERKKEIDPIQRQLSEYLLDVWKSVGGRILAYDEDALMLTLRGGEIHEENADAIAQFLRNYANKDMPLNDVIRDYFANR